MLSSPSESYARDRGWHALGDVVGACCLWHKNMLCHWWLWRPCQTADPYACQAWLHDTSCTSARLLQGILITVIQK